jgi:hypothetical protein
MMDKYCHRSVTSVDPGAIERGNGDTVVCRLMRKDRRSAQLELQRPKDGDTLTAMLDRSAHDAEGAMLWACCGWGCGQAAEGCREARELGEDNKAETWRRTCAVAGRIQGLICEDSRRITDGHTRLRRRD